MDTLRTGNVTFAPTPTISANLAAWPTDSTNVVQRRTTGAKDGRGATERDLAVARLLKPLGNAPLTRQQAIVAGKLLKVHWATVYRLRRRFLNDPVATALSPSRRGPKIGKHRLEPEVEEIVNDVLSEWLPNQRNLAHRLHALNLEVRRRCAAIHVTPPGRSTIARRWLELQDQEAQRLSELPGSAVAPGSFNARCALDIVQVDHTLADIILVDEVHRVPIGRPWLTLAVDVATRCVVGLYVAMDRPNAATVALLLTRVALPKDAWLASRDTTLDWPMHGLPKVLHLDNAAEFKSRALRTGCGQYGIELMYRPPGQPYFGGHIERLIRTIMDRVHSLPGSTGSSPKGRKARKPEAEAALTLREFERWLIYEIGQTYHHSCHRGLWGATPYSQWKSMIHAASPRLLPSSPEEHLRFLVQFLPLKHRTVQAYGLSLFYLRYWHPVFAAWRERKRRVIVRFHPEDLSRIFVSTNGKEYLEANFADLRRPPISLWEHRSALKFLRSEGHSVVTEAKIFAAVDAQRQIVEGAKGMKGAAAMRRRAEKRLASPELSTRIPPVLPETSTAQEVYQGEVDYSKPAPVFNVEPL